MNKELQETIISLAFGESGKPETSARPAHPMVGNQVVVRARTAGVHYGTLESADGDFVTLSGAHRVWTWKGAFTLSEVSQNGITGGMVATRVDAISIPSCDVGEILNLTQKANDSLSNYIES